MLTGNNLYKLDSQGKVRRINTDDIPEGQFNKYSVDYVEGKQIGDIVVRLDNTPITAHALLDGRRIFSGEHRTFYNWALENREKASSDSSFEYFTKTESEYQRFLEDNKFAETDQSYCPYFVLDKEYREVYQVVDAHGTLGYVSIEHLSEDETVIEYAKNCDVYAEPELKTLIDWVGNTDKWQYTYVNEEAEIGYVRIPTYPTYTSGNTKSYYFIVVDSRVENESTSIKSVRVGDTTTLEPSEGAYVKNSGTLQNLILDFGIPKGDIPNVSIGSVVSGEGASVVNSGNGGEVVLDFVLPRGAAGPAGGVINLHYINKLPETAKNGEKAYDAITKFIYEYNGKWVELQEVSENQIYVCRGVAYTFNGTNLIEFSTLLDVDNLTTQIKDDKLVSVGHLTKNSKLFYDWVGTLEEWTHGRASGVIEDNWVCYIVDDGTFVGDDDTSLTYIGDELDAINGEII